MKNRYQVTWECYRSWVIEKVLTKKTIMGLIIGVISLPIWLYICYTYGGNMKHFAAFFAIFCEIHFLNYTFMRPLNEEKINYQKKLQTYGKAGWIREIIIGEDILLKEGEDDVISFSYKNIDKIEEKGNQVKIVFNDHMILRLYKDAFVDSDWEACKSKLYQERYGR